MMSSLLLYVIVSVSGAAVLSLEILGTRVLGPFYGVSLFLWSALITVTLAALSVGYALGGRYADRGPRLTRLAGILAAAGIWVLLVPLLKLPLVRLGEGLELRIAVLFSSLVLFAPPLTLLGMVSPYVLRLKARDVNHVGTDAGNLFAVSTVASVAGALLTGFWLIPYLGVARLIALVGVVLLAGAALAGWAARGSESRRIATGTSVACLVLAAAGASWSLTRAEELPAGLRYHADSPYAEIRVLDRAEGRYLLLDGGVHTVVGGNVQESLHRYTPVLDSCRKLFDAPGRMLLLGLGGGVVVQNYAAAGWEVDAVEIDPEVVEVARRYFELEPDQATIHVMDARRFLETTEESWDLILIDAFGSSSIPFHLVTREFFTTLARHLAGEGVMAMNVETRGWRDPLTASLGKTLETVFPSVWSLPTSEPPNTLGNLVVVASGDPGFELLDEELEHPQDFLYDEYEHWRVLQVMHAWDNAYQPAQLAGGVVLDDDRNPVDLWSDAINREARLDLREFFEDDPALN